MNYLISFHGHWGPKKLNSYCLVPPFLSHFSFNCASSTTTTLQVWELEEKGQGMLWRECRHGSSTAECCSPAVPCFAGSDMNCVTHSPETKLGNNASNSMTRVPAQLCCHRKSYRSFLLLNTIIVLPGHLLFFVCLFYFTVISKSKVAKITDNSHMHNQFLTFCHICFFLSIYSYIHTHTHIIYVFWSTSVWFAHLTHLYPLFQCVCPKNSLKYPQYMNKFKKFNIDKIL